MLAAETVYLGSSLPSRFLISGLSYKTTFNSELRISILYPGPGHADALYLANFLSRRTRLVFSKCVVRSGLLDQGYGFTAVARRRKQSLAPTPSR
jgi:hypothetical protein